MYIINTKIYPFRGHDKYSFKDFGVLTDSLMEHLLKETKTKSPDLLIQKFNAAFQKDGKKQIMTSIIEIKILKNFPFLKISKILAS